jgi:hypothetical protein
MSPETLIPTYAVVSRHSETCPSKAKGPQYTQCGCRKRISVYDPRVQDPKKRQSYVSTKTRSRADAEIIAQNYRDTHNPDKVRAAEAEAKLKTKEEREAAQIATIEKAIARFLVFKLNNPSRRSSRRSGPTADSTMEAYRTLLGDVTATFEVKRKGNLLTWLESQNPRPTLISELTNDRIDDFRGTWAGWADLTAANAFTRLKTFFGYCEDMRWIESNPLDGRTRPSVQDGSRTAAFTNDQYQSILDKLDARAAAIREDVKNPLEAESKLADNERLRTLIELGRWGAMALEDAVCFRKSDLTGRNLRYKRAKSGKVAKPNLPEDVATRIQTVVPVNGDPNQPFRDISVVLDSDKARWSRESKQLFFDAGIKTVTTDIREREPHFHMLRDTFAVGQLELNVRDGLPSLKSIADAMGDSIPVMLKHYAPTIGKLEKAHEEGQQKIVDAQVAAMKARNGKADADVISIAGGRK